MQRHHLDAVFPGFGLAFAGFEHRVREECIQRRQRLVVGVQAIGLEAARGRHQFVQVLDARFAAIVAFSFLWCSTSPELLIT